MTTTTDMTVNLSPIIDQVLSEVRALEQNVITKSAELAQARERLAAARGKMEMIGVIQQLAAMPIRNGDPLDHLREE
jgi:hypothetical protein